MDSEYIAILFKYPKLHKAWVSDSSSLNNYIAGIHFSNQENSDIIKEDLLCIPKFQNAASGFQFALWNTFPEIIIDFLTFLVQ